MRTLSVGSSLAPALVYHLARVAAWRIGHHHAVKRVVLTPAEAEAAGLPPGSTEPMVRVRPAQPGPQFRAWHDRSETAGEACFHLRLLGWEAEVPYR